MSRNKLAGIIVACAVVIMVGIVLLVFKPWQGPTYNPYNPEAAWNKTFGGSDDDYGFSVLQTSDGGFIIGGYTHSYGAGNGDAWLIKTDSSGNEMWNKTFGGSYYDYGSSVRQTSDGGYIIAGDTESYGVGHTNVWLIKTDSSGHVEWTQTFGGSGSDYGRSVQQTSDGGFIIGGSRRFYGAGDGDIWLIKVTVLPEP